MGKIASIAASADIIPEASRQLPGLPRRCLVAVFRISVPHSAATLLSAASSIQSLLRTHQWLSSDLELYCPDLYLLRRKHFQHDGPRERYPAGSTSKILRALLTSSDPSISSLQALLLSISARYHAHLPDDQFYPERPELAASPLSSRWRLGYRLGLW